MKPKKEKSVNDPKAKSGPKQLDSAENEEESWQKVAQQGFLNAYDDDEPDYTHARLLEPNPKYKP
jgi:hypothetical protein